MSSDLVNRPDLRWPFPADMAGRLTGQKVLQLRRRSKYILADLASGESLLIHLGMSGRMLVFYIGAQVIGGVLGVWAAHMMFDLPILQTSTTLHRTGLAQWFSEGIATFGLLFVIFGGLRSRPDAVPMLVALYITGAYWFTASTSFANPAVTFARGWSDTFAGIYPGHIVGFVVVQFGVVFGAHFLLKALFPEE